MAQKLAPAEKNSTDISAASAAFCISVFDSIKYDKMHHNTWKERILYFKFSFLSHCHITQPSHQSDFLLEQIHLNLCYFAFLETFFCQDHQQNKSLNLENPRHSSWLWSASWWPRVRTTGGRTGGRTGVRTSVSRTETEECLVGTE